MRLQRASDPAEAELTGFQQKRCFCIACLLLLFFTLPVTPYRKSCVNFGNAFVKLYTTAASMHCQRSPTACCVTTYVFQDIQHKNWGLFAHRNGWTWVNYNWDPTVAWGKTFVKGFVNLQDVNVMFKYNFYTVICSHELTECESTRLMAGFSVANVSLYVPLHVFHALWYHFR